jgi:hypothetical protein
MCTECVVRKGKSPKKLKSNHMRIHGVDIIDTKQIPKDLGRDAGADPNDHNFLII